MLQVKQLYNFSEYTILLAILLFDKFACMNAKNLDDSVVPLIAVVCLQISVKIHERSVL